MILFFGTIVLSALLAYLFYKHFRDYFRRYNVLGNTAAIAGGGIGFLVAFVTQLIIAANVCNYEYIEYPLVRNSVPDQQPAMCLLSTNGLTFSVLKYIENGQIQSQTISLNMDNIKIRNAEDRPVIIGRVRTASKGTWYRWAWICNSSYRKGACLSDEEYTKACIPASWL